MPFDAAIAILFFAAWVLMAIGLAVAYRWMRNSERDTRLEQELGRTPALEVIGAGRINRRQWSRGQGCRVSVYDDFFVVSVSSQRLAFPLYRIRDIVTDPSSDRLTVRVLAADESLVSVDFRGKDAVPLAACLREHGRGGAKVAGPA